MDQNQQYSHQPLFFSEKEDIQSVISPFLLTNTKHYFLVSGGADSMFMIHLVFDYFFTVGLDVSSIILLHYNHGYRDSSEKDQLFIEHYFSDFTVFVGHYTGEKNTERDRRLARQTFISSIIDRNGQGYIYTGHNLTDRLETSCLHLVRGCNISGIKNMHMIDEFTYINNTAIVLRPLLCLPKPEIFRHCREHNIPYRQDESNFDRDLSQRNNCRYLLEKTLQGKYSVLKDELVSLYNYLEQKETHTLPVCSLCPHPEWRATAYYKTTIPQSLSALMSLFTFCSIYSNITRALLEEVYKFLRNSSSGWKYVQGWYVILAHKYVYLVYTGDDTPFWYTPPISPGDESIGTSKAAKSGVNIRYPQAGDMRKGKKLTKQMISSKIPFFRRPYIKVVEKDKNIKDLLFSPNSW